MRFAAVCSLVLIAHSSALGSGLIINYDNDPDLAFALEHDEEMNGGDLEKADRAVAQKHYLAYLERCEESFQRAKVYCQLGVMHTTNRQKGEEADYEKARLYFMKVLEEEPERIGSATIRARTQHASIPGDREEPIRARMDVYEWALGLDEKAIRRLWLPDRPGDAEPTDKEITNMARRLEEIRLVLLYNMMSGARSSPRGSVLLGEIIRRFPGTRAEELARMALKRPNPRAMESDATDLLVELAEEALENGRVTTEDASAAADAAEPEAPEAREVPQAPVEEPAAPRRTPVWTLATAGALIMAVIALAFWRRARRR